VGVVRYGCGEGVGARWRSRGGGPGSRQRPGAAEAGVGQVAHEQGRRGEGSSVRWGPLGREREGARGPAQEMEEWAGSKGIVKILIYSNNFQTSSNCFDQKLDLSSSKNFK
jgi:hypothetical protein